MPFFDKGLFRLLLILFPLVIFFSAPALCQEEETEGKKEKRIYGTFTIGPDGETYMFLPETAAKLRVGQVVKGVVPDEVIEALAKASEIQKYSLLAADAWQWCLKAQKDYEAGLVSRATKDLACAAAYKYTAKAETVWAGEWVKTNPDAGVVKGAQDVFSKEQSNFEAAVALEASALAAGGELAQIEGYEGEERTTIAAPATLIQREIEPQLRGLPPRDLPEDTDRASPF